MLKVFNRSLFGSHTFYVFVTLFALVLLVSFSFFAGSFLIPAVTRTNPSSNAPSGSPHTVESIRSSLNPTNTGGVSLATTSNTNDWTTYHHDNNRTGYTSSIPAISSPAIDWKGKVDGAVYAEPLYYNGFVYIATENNTVYALKATTGAIEWSEHLGAPADSLAAPYACNGNGPDITPVIGITGTPVIDSSTGTMYVAALIRNDGYLLFAIDASTGQQLWYSTITAPNFNYLPQEQRGALAFANGLVYVPFGGYSWSCFNPGPTGWIIAMSASGSGEKYTYNVPSRPEGDIWTPEGVSVDSSGNVYVSTGDSNNATFDFGNSVIKLTPDLSFIDSTINYFAPSDWQYTNTNDLDLGDTGATLLPDNLIFAIGKMNIGYLLNASNLGGINGQVYSAQVCGAINASWPYGAWGATSFANGVIYVPCATGLEALKLQTGSHPSFTSLWNYSGIWAGPPIIAGGAVWTVSIPGGNLYALNPSTGSVLYHTSLSTVEHFTTPTAGDGLIFVPANQTIYALNPAPSSTSSSVTVDSKNTNGQTINGYHVLLSQNGKTIASGYTPVTFPLNSGQTYSVDAQSYGSCTFSHWSDGVTSDPRTFTASSGSTTFTAVYNCATFSTATVKSVNQIGNAMSGYYTVLYNSAGSVVGTGFTPVTFNVTVGQTYRVTADSYGACTFSHWSDGVTSNPRTFTASSSAITFTAVYSCSSEITVKSVNQDGGAIAGYHVILYDSSGGIVSEGFTPTTFNANLGQSYSLLAQSYGSCQFSFWLGQTTTNGKLTFTAGSGGQTFTAVYDCNNKGSSTITVYAHRIPASYWAPCFATACAAGTGPGASMYFALYNSAGTLIATGFANENGYTFSGLTLGATYYVQADNCDSCHGSSHDVLFNHWGNGDTTDPLQVVAGANLDAWYTCTNGCA